MVTVVVYEYESGGFVPELIATLVAVVQSVMDVIPVIRYTLLATVMGMAVPVVERLLDHTALALDQFDKSILSATLPGLINLIRS